MVVVPTQDHAFPTLTEHEMNHIRELAIAQDVADGTVVFKVGDADIDLVVVESGQLNILNPADDNKVIVHHKPREFAGDIDLITRRPVIVTAVAHGPTRILRVPSKKMRELLNRIPRLSEKLMDAFTGRRKMLAESGIFGMTVIGPGRCKDTNLVREFLYKNFVPFMWFDPETVEGKRRLVKLGSPRKSPVIECGDGRVLVNPTIRELALCAGVLAPCPSDAIYDLVVVGAGPAGISAAVYAASEGLSTLVVDKLGPGGQASGSSRIENFIGFPAGLSGIDFATRGVLQMMKFGARIATPVTVLRLEPASDDEFHRLHMDCGSVVRARTILIATGVHWRRLDAQNAEAFEGSGIFYLCTSTEATLYDNCDVAVVGGGNSAGQAAVYMSEFCRKRHVHVLVRRGLEDKMSSYLVDRIRSSENITVHEGVEISKINGTRKIESVDLKSRDGTPKGSLSLNAVFVFTGAEPSGSWLPDSVCRDKLGYLLTGSEVSRSGLWPLKDRDPCPLETTIPGLLAAGDVRSASTKRVGFAVGDGSLAVTCIHHLRSLVPEVTRTP